MSTVQYPTNDQPTVHPRELADPAPGYPKDGYDATEIQSRICDLANVNLDDYLREVYDYAKRYGLKGDQRMNAGHAILILMPIDNWHHLMMWHQRNREDKKNRGSYLNNALAELGAFEVYELLGLWRSSGVSDG